jgi:hypothetical protein
MNMDHVEGNGTNLTQISQYLMTLTASQVATTDSVIRPGHGDDPAFQIAYPAAMINHLPCLPEAQRGEAPP